MGLMADYRQRLIELTQEITTSSSRDSDRVFSFEGAIPWRDLVGAPGRRSSA